MQLKRDKYKDTALFTRKRHSLEDYRHAGIDLKAQLNLATVINALISGSRSVFENSLSGDGVKLELPLIDQEPLWTMDSVRFKQALLNLVINAAEALKDSADGRIVIETSVSNSQNFAISVSDNGCGITEDNKDKVMDLFFYDERLVRHGTRACNGSKVC